MSPFTNSFAVQRLLTLSSGTASGTAVLLHVDTSSTVRWSERLDTYEPPEKNKVQEMFPNIPPDVSDAAVLEAQLDVEAAVASCLSWVAEQEHAAQQLEDRFTQGAVQLDPSLEAEACEDIERAEQLQLRARLSVPM